MGRDVRRIARSTLVAGALMLLVPAAASAAGTVNVSFGTVTFTAEANKVNDVTVTSAPGTIVISDAEPVADGEAGTICAQTFANVVTCTDPGLAYWELNLGDLSDEATASGSLDGGMSGGLGDDDLIATGVSGTVDLQGHQGLDELRGGSGESDQDGGAGNDTLIGGPGADRLAGGPDHDTITGNAGSDTAQAPDSGAADSDSVSLGAGADILVGAGIGTVANLGPDDDLLFVADQIPNQNGSVDGSTGVDEVTLVSQNAFHGSTIDLAAGKTTVNGVAAMTTTGFENVGGGEGGATVVTGTAGANQIVTHLALILGGQFGLPGGENSNDVVNPLGGADIVRTGGGADKLTLADGYVDTADCGPGVDTVSADQLDVLADCETVTRTNVAVFGAPAADRRAPSCSFTKAAKTAKASSFAKAYAATFRCDEAVSVNGQILVAAKRKRGKVVFAKAGDVVLAETSTSAGAGAAKKLTLRPTKRLRKSLPKKYRARVVLQARDEFGNRTTITRTVKVSTPKKKRRKK
jgi:Ca2+-binding RTX toxin-like protein